MVEDNERFNGLLKTEVLASVAEAQALVSRYCKEFNEEMPHSALHHRTPQWAAEQAKKEGNWYVPPDSHD